MIAQFFNRQGFEKSLSGVNGTAIQSVYTKPIIDSGYKACEAANVSWKYPLGDPWGWSIYPWNWGKEGEADKEKPTPDGSPPGAQGGIPESTSGNMLMLLVVAGAAFFLVYAPGRIFK